LEKARTIVPEQQELNEKSPPGFGPDKEHSDIYNKVKAQYPGEPEKAYATMWKIHNKITETLGENATLEEKKKWIQKAIKKSHKGYCTPMTKSTCTPRRKALAKRFKSGDLSETHEKTPDFPDKEKVEKKPATQTVSKLQKEAVFISRKINEGRELTDEEKKIIKEIVISKALRMKENFDEKGWEHAAEATSGMLDSYIEDTVKYRSKTDTVEDLVDSITVTAEDRLGIRHPDFEAIENQVKKLWNKYPAKY